MTVLSDYVARMVDGGMDQDEAMQVAAELFAAGAAAASLRPTKAALRTRKWRLKTSPRDAQEESGHTVTERHQPSPTVTGDKAPLSTKSNNKKVERQNRGSRITPDWTPSVAERAFAQQEGFSEVEISREVAKFRDHWASTPGSKGVKLDWSATWRKWIRNAAEWSGKAPSAPSGTVNQLFYAKTGSEQLAAWDAYGLRTSGKGMPRDRNQGWHVKSEWPPDYEPPEQAHEPPPPMLRMIQ